MPETNTWNNYRQLVLSELEKNSEKLEKLSDDLVEIKTDIAVLKNSATIWGMVGGFIISSIVTIIASIIGSFI